MTTGTNVRGFTYAASGQVTEDVRDPSHDYTFPLTRYGRITSAALNGATVGTYVYDAFENRVQKTVGTTVTDYIYDRFGHLLYEANDATGALTREYIWQDDLPVAIVDDTGASPVTYYIQADHLGTPQKITDGSSAVVWDGAFDPFGSPVSVTGALTNNLRFPGQYFDAETSLHQNWHRDYDPSVGRYIESDPVGLESGVNTYVYGLNNPYYWKDPTGQGALGAALGAVIGAAATAETGPGAIGGALEGAALGSDIEDLLADTYKKWTEFRCNCLQLNADVQKAKAVVGGLGKCKVGMSMWQLQQRAQAWLGEARARAKRDQTCWQGGDENHQDAQRRAWSNLGNC